MRWVAGCSHIRTFIAGATSTRLSVASSSGRGEVVGEAVRHAGEQIGGRRRDDHEIGRARQLDMADQRFVGEAEQSSRTGCPLSAAADSGVTNSRAAAVITT